MKKIFAMVIALVAILTVEAQPQIANVSKINVFGVDFSKTKVKGADELDEAFVKAFDGINNLLLLEPTKYNFDKAFKKQVESTDVAPTKKNNEARDFSTMRVNPNELVSMDEIKGLVSGYELPKTEGTGVVFVAMLLDKSSGTAKHCVVFFDIATRQIIFSREVTAKAGGFSLRNFWANPIYNILKTWTVK